MPDIKKIVGQNIKKYRIKRGWKQSTLSSESGLNRTYISQIERGEKNIGLVNLEKIARALGVNIQKLFR